MLVLENISFRAGKHEILKDVSLNLRSGELTLLIGPNGAGKSTLISIMSGLLKPTGGKVLFHRASIHGMNKNSLARQRAVLSQQIEVMFPLTVNEVIMMGRYPFFTGKPSPKDEEICLKAMEHFEVGSFYDRHFDSLSGGEKQRVHFARVAAQIWEVENGFLLLDEPLTFLDVLYQHRFMRKIRELMTERNLAVIGVLHDLNLVAQYADRLVLLREGQIMNAGNVEAVFTSPNLSSLFKIQAEVTDNKGNRTVIFRE